MITNRTDCIANFHFEGNVNNLAENGVNGTVTGVEQYADSIIGKSFDFNGSSRVEIGNSALLNSSDLTVFLKMNLDTHTAGDRIFAKRIVGNGNGFFFTVYSAGTDKLMFRVRNAADTEWISVSVNIPENILYAIRCEINLGSEITISYYTIDGVFTTSSTAFTDSTYASNLDNISIGDFAGGNNGLDGKIDQFMIYTSILDNSDAEFYNFYIGEDITDL